MKKIIMLSSLVLAIIFLAGCDKQQTAQIQPAKISGTTITGVLIKNSWEKSANSYCAQGSDYYTLKTANQELVLEFEPIFSETQMSDIAGKNVAITGEMKTKKIECPPGQQCLSTPNDVYTCEVFKINKISESE